MEKTVFNKKTGKIIAMLNKATAPEVEHYLNEGLGVMDGGYFPNDFYIKEGEAVPINKFEPVIDVAGLSVLVSNLPVGTSVRVKNASVLADETGEVNISFEQPGKYAIRLENVIGYLDSVEVVNLG